MPQSKIDKKSLATAINNIEAEKVDKQFYHELAEIHHNCATPVIGFIGPPGVGKSSLIGALIPFFTRKKLNLCLLLVDPASDFSKGALLGDKLRLAKNARNEKVFIRSQSSGANYGGLAHDSYPVINLMRKYADIIIVEAVGSGQRESALAYLADLLIYCLPPQGGDFIQMAKSGNMQFEAIHIITKADSGDSAKKAAIQLQNLKLYDKQNQNNEPFLVSAHDNKTVETLAEAITNRLAKIDDSTRKKKRKEGMKFWLTEAIKNKYGSEGLKKISGKFDINKMENHITNPFFEFKQ